MADDGTDLDSAPSLSGCTVLWYNVALHNGKVWSQLCPHAKMREESIDDLLVAML